MGDHLLVGELVAVGALDDAVEEEDGAESLSLDHGHVLQGRGGSRNSEGLHGWDQRLGGSKIGWVARWHIDAAPTWKSLRPLKITSSTFRDMP